MQPERGVWVSGVIHSCLLQHAVLAPPAVLCRQPAHPACTKPALFCLQCTHTSLLWLPCRRDGHVAGTHHPLLLPGLL